MCLEQLTNEQSTTFWSLSYCVTTIKPDLSAEARQAERVHCRWAMLAVAGILVQEIVRPDVFWYNAATKVDIGGPEKILGLVRSQFACLLTRFQQGRWV